MPKKIRPYSDINRNRTLPNSSLKKNTNNKKNTTKEKPKNLENTTRIKIDKERNIDLDNSFLEVRLKDQNARKKEKENLLRKKETIYRQLEVLKIMFFTLSFLCIIVLVILLIMNSNRHLKPKDVKTEEKDTPVVEKVIDDNYLFVGDIHTVNLPIEEKYPSVRMAEDHMTTEVLLNDLENKVYIYNPSVVFIELGLEDLAMGLRIEDVINHYQMIVQNIQENRPNATIYIESLYPVYKDKIDSNSPYKDINNATIKKLNQELKNLSSQYKVHYIDLFSKLIMNDQLSEKYTVDGITLNEDGYSVVWKNILKIIKEE